MSARQIRRGFIITVDVFQPTPRNVGKPERLGPGQQSPGRFPAGVVQRLRRTPHREEIVVGVAQTPLERFVTHQLHLVVSFLLVKDGEIAFLLRDHVA